MLCKHYQEETIRTETFVHAYTHPICCTAVCTVSNKNIYANIKRKLSCKC